VPPTDRQSYTNQTKYRRLKRRNSGIPKPLLVVLIALVTVSILDLGLYFNLPIFSHVSAAFVQLTAGKSDNPPADASDAASSASDAARPTPVEQAASTSAAAGQAPTEPPAPTQTPAEPQVPTQTPTEQPPAAQAAIEQPIENLDAAAQQADAPDANAWMSLPVVPTISNTAREIYQKGLALGNNPNAFSKIGDCNSLSLRFLTYFDGDPGTVFNLGDYAYLQPAIDQFSGSFKRQSQAVGDGFNTSAVLSQFRADPHTCKAGESPLTCEYRLHKPSFAFISIGTDDYLKPDIFEANLRKIIATSINLGIVPILATKADNANQLNYNPIIARLAGEYDIPLWNLWRAMQPLPENGMVDNIHPTGEFAAFDFSGDNLTRYGWPVRNLTALQALYATWNAVTKP